MTAKFIRRTMRNVIFPRQPYFVHLAITHRCNLKCRFCHVTQTRFAELDTEGTKRVIDRLDRMGVAVVSISGGGEPLLREDFDEIVNYAALGCPYAIRGLLTTRSGPWALSGALSSSDGVRLRVSRQGRDIIDERRCSWPGKGSPA